ncbi:MAG: AsmA family protein [Elusimicrobiota bacterium]|jgi:AsmA protein|nr:AsmA family protein [Elusimicrobiota bacterium]
MTANKLVSKKINAKKLIARIIICCFLFLISLLFVLDMALKYVLPLDFVKNKIAQSVLDASGMRLEIISLRGGLRGLYARGINLSDGKTPLLNIEKLNIEISPRHLLKGEIYSNAVLAEGLVLQIVKNQDGGFNFDKLFSNNAQNQPSDENAAAYLPKFFIKTLQIQNSAVNYFDKTQNINVKANKFFLDVHNFSLDKQFRASLNANVAADINRKIKFDNIPLALTLYPNLQNLDLPSARAELNFFVLRHPQSDFILTLNGKALDFQSPQVSFALSARNISAQSFGFLTNLPDFFIALITASSKVNFNINKNTILINDFNLDLLSSRINANGNINYGGDKAEYNISAAANIALEPLAQAAPALLNYKPFGAFSANANITDAQINANARLENAGAFIAQVGNLTELNFEAVLNGVKDIKIPSFTGKLNGNPLAFNAYYLDSGEEADLNLFFKADKLALKTDYAQNAAAQAGRAQEQADKNSVLTKWPLPPLNVKADVSVKKLDAPFLSGSDIVFKADVRGITPRLNKTGGSLNLVASKGKIKDLYKLTDANALTKVLFMSLSVVSKVINTLDVLSVLNAIGSSVSGGVKDSGDELEDKPSKLSGELNYDRFSTSLNFGGGKSVVKRLHFQSDKLSFAVKGDINFDNRKIAMTVNAAPGNVSASGIMPIALKIGGTLEEPKGSMSMLSSTASLLKQSVLNNPASNLLKNTLGNIGHLLGAEIKNGNPAGADEYIDISPVQPDINAAQQPGGAET